MRSISVFCLISSLFFSCISVLATPLTGTILQRRDEIFSNDLPGSPEALDDATLKKSLVEPTDPVEPKKLEKIEKSEKIKKLAHRDEGLRGMRCGAALYTQGNLVDAATQACKLMKEKKRTWGIYTQSYKEEKSRCFLSVFIGRTGPHRIIINRECQVAGAVTKLNNRTKCQGNNCWNPFRYQHLIYKTCDLDYYK